jgi:hypothetical protein
MALLVTCRALQRSLCAEVRMKFIGRCTHADRDAVNRLRVEQFGGATDFALLDSSRICWSGETGAGAVLAAWDSGACLATMEGEIVTDSDRASELLGCRLELSVESFPALALTRAATSGMARRSGLNSALRYYFFDAVGDVRTVLGTVYARSARTNLMASLKYDFHTLSPDRYLDLEIVRANRECWLAVLPRTRLENALASLKELAAEALEGYPWRGPPLALSAPPWLPAAAVTPCTAH